MEEIWECSGGVAGGWVGVEKLGWPLSSLCCPGRQRGPIERLWKCEQSGILGILIWKWGRGGWGELGGEYGRI